MSDLTLATTPPSTPASASPSIICCGADLCSQLPADKLPWLRLVIGIFVAAQTMMLGMTINLTAPDDRTTLLLLDTGMLGATLLVVALLGWPLAVEAFAQLLRQRLTMELFFVIGILASLGISLWSMITGQGPVYFEVVNVLLVIHSVGRAITSHSRTKALAATGRMLDEVAHARLLDGTIVAVTALAPGQRIRVAPGELVPVDGQVVDGQSLVRSTSFSGEWQSFAKRAGDAVLAGSACEDGTLTVEATARGTDRRIDKLAALITSACSTSSPWQRLADRFVRLFLPLVLLSAIATLIGWSFHAGWTIALFNALSVLLVACPCAAGLAVPLATWTAINQLARKGLLLKSADALERLATVQRIVFDKTGTLADERLELKEITTAPDPQQRARTLAILAAVERHSEHPVAKALREMPQQWHEGIAVNEVRTLPGKGIEAVITVDGRDRRLRLVQRPNTDDLTIDATMDDLWIATAIFTERMRESADKAVRDLAAIGLPAEIMTGDRSASARRAQSLAPVSSGMTPEQKHQAAISASQRILFVGDGVNDAAAMAQSHCSIAMSSGADISIATADATLHGGELGVIADAILLARRAVETIRWNFYWAILYNAAGMALAMAGLLHPVIAAILMSLSSAIVAWRSFHLTSAPAPLLPLANVAQRSSDISVATNAKNAPAYGVDLTYAAAHLVGMVGQAIVLIYLAQLSGLAAIITIALFVAAAALIIRFAPRLPAWADMTLAMFSLGGLGMNLGWWLDLRFDPAIHNGIVKACCIIDKTIELTGTSAQTHWMYWLMLLAGVPAMFLLRHGPIIFDWRKWCCTGMLLIGVPGMCFGMWAGAQLASRLPLFDDGLQVVLSYALMMLGMCAGMVLPHAIELTWRTTRIHIPGRGDSHPY